MKYLLEIGLEELPTSVMKKLDIQLKKLAEKFIEDELLEVEKILVGVAPRRLVLILEGLQPTTKEKRYQIKGPPKRICFSPEGNILKPLEAFLKKNEVKLEEIEYENSPKGEYIVVNKVESGKPVEVVLHSLASALFEKLTFPKKMKWGEGEYSFIRPLRWVVSFLGNQHLKVEIAGINSDKFTYKTGPRRNEKISLTGVGDYLEKLEKEKIELFPSKRKANILTQLQEKENELQAEADKDDELISEIVNLTETPYLIEAQFDSRYLSLPSEVLIETIKKNQKFVVFFQKGKLINNFVGFYNGIPSEKAISNAQNGYSRVVEARLSDAKYFYEKDLKKDFFALYEQLEEVVYHYKLSSLKRKADNVKELVLTLNKMLNLGLEEEKLIKIAQLYKTDLLTEMVYEFPELQGIMGRIYIGKKYGDPQIATAIEEHYWPRFKGDKIPETKYGILIALADKLETVYGASVASIKVSGSSDPYGIRRMANGILEIVVNRGISFNIKMILPKLESVFADLIEKNKTDVSKVRAHFENFLIQRANQYFLEKGYKYDYINSVLAIKDKIDFYDFKLKLDALTKVSEELNINLIVTPAVRINNILKDYVTEKLPQPELFREKEEEELFSYFKEKEEELKFSYQQRDYERNLKIIISFSQILDKFFDKVMVNDKDEKIKENRYRLLYLLKKTFFQMVDFTKLVKEGDK